MIRIASRTYFQILAHALAGLPNEACGALSWRVDTEVIDGFHGLTNVARSSRIFAIEPAEQMSLETQLDAANRELVGIMHSHTHTSPYPSPTDVEDIGRFDPLGSLIHAIVSLRHPEPILRVYSVTDAKISEQRILIVDDPYDEPPVPKASATVHSLRPDT